MKNFPFILFCLSFLTFCAVCGYCLLLLLFPFGLFHPVIACDTKVLELGTINNDTDVDCRFEIKNVGNSELHFHEVVPACGSGNEIRIIDVSLEPLLPGGKREIKVRFRPFSLRDNVLKKFVILSNDPKTPRLILSISATVYYVPPPQLPAPLLAPIVP